MWTFALMFKPAVYKTGKKYYKKNITKPSVYTCTWIWTPS